MTATNSVELPTKILDRVRRICLSLPEVTVRVDESLVPTRSTAFSFDVRKRSFCLLVAGERDPGRRVTMVVLRAEQQDRAALLAAGRPFFAPRAGGDRIGMVITDDPDWVEVEELVTDSYRVLAPKKLIAQIDD